MFRPDPYHTKRRRHARGDNIHKRAARGAARLHANVRHEAQKKIELMLREHGVRWHTYMRELSCVPRHHADDKRAYWAYQNVIRKYGRNAA